VIVDPVVDGDGDGDDCCLHIAVAVNVNETVAVNAILHAVPRNDATHLYKSG